MPTWVIVMMSISGYLLGWIITARVVAVSSLEHRAATRREHSEERIKRAAGYHYGITEEIRAEEALKPVVTHDDRVMAAADGLLAGMVWPFVLPARLFIHTLKAPSELAHEQRQEIERLRALAREHGLPMGDER